LSGTILLLRAEPRVLDAHEAGPHNHFRLTMVIKKIISGAQTGADRAALDAALALGLPIGGWVPRGRKAEDGPIPERYPDLRETDTDDYETRTRLNVQDADATLILSHGLLSGGSKFTEAVARSLGKPVRHVDLGATSIPDAVSAIPLGAARRDARRGRPAREQRPGDL